MMRSRSPVRAAATPVVAGVLAARLPTLMGRCVAAHGPVADLVARWQALGLGPDCPAGSVGAVSSGPAVALALAVPLVALHAVLAACGWHLATMAARVRSTLLGALRRVLQRAPGAGVVIEAPAGAAVPERWRGRRPARLLPAAAHPHRGPPLLPA